MARVNVYLPDQLLAAVRGELPDLNISATLRGSLEELLGCGHHALGCRHCGAELTTAEVAGPVLEELYRELMAGLEPLVWRCGTAEGAARIARDVGVRHSIVAASGPLPRPTRAERDRASWPEGDEAA